MKRIVTGAVLALALLAALPGHAEAKGAKRTATIVVGGYINEFAACVPTDVPDGTTVSVRCEIASFWDGAWTGHTKGELIGTVDAEGNTVGTYKETLYATYTPDGSYGTVSFEGTIWIDGPSTVFHAQAEIVGGTCGFAASSGTLTADGQAANGGYRAVWYRSPTAASDPSCLVTP